jgi:hypothetical protein
MPGSLSSTLPLYLQRIVNNRKNDTSSDKPFPTLFKEREPLWYRVPQNSLTKEKGTKLIWSYACVCTCVPAYSNACVFPYFVTFVAHNVMRFCAGTSPSTPTCARVCLMPAHTHPHMVTSFLST